MCNVTTLKRGRRRLPRLTVTVGTLTKARSMVLRLINAAAREFSTESDNECGVILEAAL